MPHGLPLPFFYILDVLYFGQRRSALCLSVDHTNQSLMPRSQKNKCIFLLQHLAAASQRSPRKSLFIYHRAATQTQPFWELLRSCLPSRSPVIFLVYSWAQWRRKPSPCMLPSSTAQAGSRAHCQNTGWLLLSEISILFVSLVTLVSLIMCIFFLFLSFLVQNNRFLGELWVFWRCSYEADCEKAWTCYTALFPCWDTPGGRARLPGSNHKIHAHGVPFTYKRWQQNQAPGPSPRTARPPQSLKARCDSSLQQIRIYPPHTAPAKTHLRLSWAPPAPGVSGKALAQSSWQLLQPR